MASGTITGSGSKVNLKISWSSTKGNGGSTVSATLYAVNNGGYYFYAAVNQGYSLTINGSSVSGSTAQLSSTANGSSALISHSVWVPYTGNKSITISGSANLSNIYADGAIGNRSASGSAALDKIGSIPSKPSFTAPTTGIISETGGTIVVSWNKATSYNNSATYDLQVSINGGSWTSITKSLSIGTTSYNYSYSAGQGNTYRFAIQAINDIGASGFNYSDTVTTNSLSAPTIGTISTYNPYISSTLSVPLSGGSQTNGGAFTRWAELYYGSTKLATCDTPSNGNTTASISYSANNFISKLGTTKYSDTFTIKAWTQNGNGTKSNTVSNTFTVNINTDGGATPTLEVPTLSGGAFDNPSTCFIKGVSTLTITSATGVTRRAPSGTTLSYSISVSGTYSTGGSTASYSNLTAGVKTITVTCTDSRGLSTSVSVQCVVQDYTTPTIKSFSISRLDNPNTSAKATYELYYTPIYQYTDPETKGNQLNGINSQQYNLDDGVWDDYTSGTIINGLNIDTLYKFNLRVSDNVKTTTYTNAYGTIYTIKHTLSMRNNGLGINCVPQSGYALDVGGNARVSNGIYSGTVNYVIGGRNRQPIQMFEGDANGDGIKIEAGGALVIGCGESPGNFINGASLGGTTETTYITSDDSILFATNMQNGYSSRKEMSMNNGQLIRGGYSSTWVNGRANALIRQNTINGYSACISIKTTNGSWEIGAYDYSSHTDKLVFSYLTDSNYNSGSNSTTGQITFTGSGNIQVGGQNVLTIDSAFPVGAVYITYNNNNPGNFLGGTWVQFGQGRVLIGQGTGNDGSTSMSFTANSTGGTYTETLTTEQIPAHSHDYYSPVVQKVQAISSGSTYGNYNKQYKIATGSSGGGKAHNNLPPYLSVYFWRRTA